MHHHTIPVSYTHLDVYKRQVVSLFACLAAFLCEYTVPSLYDFLGKGKLLDLIGKNTYKEESCETNQNIMQYTD